MLNYGAKHKFYSVKSLANGKSPGSDGLTIDFYKKFVNLQNVTGIFSAGEKIKVSDSAETDSIVESSANVDLTISEITVQTFSDARSVFMEDADSGQDFTADFVLESASGEEGSIALNGTDIATGTLDAGDNILLEEGSASLYEGAGEISRELPQVARLKDTEKNRALFKLPKKVIKTLLTVTNGGVTDTQYTVRRQFTGTTNASGVVTFNAGTNETFASFVERDYTMSILTAGGGTGAQGDIVTVSGAGSGGGVSASGGYHAAGGGGGALCARAAGSISGPTGGPVRGCSFRQWWAGAECCFRCGRVGCLGGG